MKRLKQLNSVVREYNGMVAKYTKNPVPENKKLMDDCVLKLKEEVDKILP